MNSAQLFKLGLSLRPPWRGRLLYKYVALMITVMGSVLLLNGIINIWMSYDEQKRSLVRLQREQAQAGATRIAQYIRELETQLGWLVQSPWALSTDDDRRVDGIRLMNLVPAVHEITVIDPTGNEQVRLSRLGSDVVGSRKDWSETGPFTQARSGATFYGPVYFQRNSEPYIRLAISGQRRDSGVVVADINLKLIWDVISAIRIGERGKAYVVDGDGHLVAHPDISLVLRNTDLSSLHQVQTALRGDADTATGQVVRDSQRQQVLAAHASISPVGWYLIVELPVSEAFAPVYSSLKATLGVLAAGLGLAVLSSFVLAKTMVTPIRELQSGASTIGNGALDHRIAISTGDELEELGSQFNEMASRLEISYATLEQKVDDRTRQLALANQAKSRFLAAASHDLRQPLNALNLFVAKLRYADSSDDKRPLVGRIEAALRNMNELFDALLDISKLDAGVITADVVNFPIGKMLDRIETTFATAAQSKGLRLRIVSSTACVRSDTVLLERIISNLVSNAIRYTNEGGIVVGLRRRGACLSIDICDSGIGIPHAQLGNVFAEFYRVSGPNKLGGSGLGLGLSIVDRLAQLLDHPVEIQSREGIGSRFSVLVPLARADATAEIPASEEDTLSHDFGAGMCVLVVDDDLLALDAMTCTLEGWGFEVIEAASAKQALSLVGKTARLDVVISDYHLGDGETGLAMIRRINSVLAEPIPALIVSGAPSVDLMRDIKSSGYQLLTKPVMPFTLRAVVSKILGNPPRIAKVETTVS